MRISQRITPFAGLKPTRSLVAIFSASLLLAQLPHASGGQSDVLDQQLTARLQQLGFTGNVEATLEQRLGRAVDPARACSQNRAQWPPDLGLPV
ncbi:MAG: hypothetical protein L0Z50_22850 [Verrucomicrobiales bacterium]|nr:hypothetical protein [Verrucomicrobiales bacterium]